MTLYLIYILYSLKVGLGVFWYEWLLFVLLLVITSSWDMAKITYINNLNDDKQNYNKAKDKKTSPFGKIT